MTIQELRKLTAADLVIELQKARAELGAIRFLVKAGQDAATHKVGNAAKNIARIQTVITEINS